MTSSRREFLAGTGGAILAAAAPSANAATPDPLRLACFSANGENAPRIAVVVGNSDMLLDVTAEAKRRGMTLPFDPSDMVSLIASGEPGLAAVRALAQGGQALVPYGSVRHWSPVPRPARNIYAVGWNYLEHFAESATAKAANTSYPEHPVFFTKGTHTMNGPFDSIPFDPKVSTLIDWEGELAVVIGKRGKNIPEAEAMNYVFGYSVINDTTARDVQQKRHGGQWFKGKSLDLYGPMGPWIVEASALDPDKLHLVTRVNGVVKQDAMTTQMFFKVPRIIAELSLGLTLEPGDVIATGTPPGVGVGRTPPEFLKPGDVMETEIAGIGKISNTIALVS